MKRICVRWIAPAVLLLVLTMTVYGGGWASVTVKNLPEYFVAGKQATLTFVVRQHGISLTDRLPVTLIASAAGGPEAKAVITPTGKGEYTAALILPRAGNWTIRIHIGLWESYPPYTLLPMQAIAADSPAPQALSEVAKGERLFVAKGCNGCHVNKEVAAENLVSVGPDLTGKKFPLDYLRKFLADPAGTKGKAPSPSYGEMPNLDLEKDEIAALAAFINRERPIARR